MLRVGSLAQRAPFVPLLTVALIGSLWVPTAGGQERPPAVSQYVEMIPTPKGEHPASNADVERTQLTERERRAVESQQPGVSKTLKDVASSTAFGAPQTTPSGKTQSTGAQGEDTASSGRVAADATYTDASSLTPYVLFGALAFATIALAGGVALARRR